jgi:hypothetical protein
LSSDSYKIKLDWDITNDQYILDLENEEFHVRSTIPKDQIHTLMAAFYKTIRTAEGKR